MYESTKIAERIRFAAKEKGVSVNALLKSIGLSKNTVSSLLAGSMIATDSIAKIADALDCSVDYLLGRSDTRTQNPTDLSDEALSLAEAFDRADERSQAMVRLALEPFSGCVASKKAM